MVTKVKDTAISATLTGLLKGTSGNLATAVAGTDYPPVASPTFTGTVTSPAYTTSNLATTPTYGSDLLAGIGNFTSATGWTLGTGWSITGGQAVYTTGGGTLSATIAVVSGTKYQIDWTHVSGSYNITATVGAVSTVAMPYWGNKSITIVAGATGSLTLTIAMDAAATIDALTIKQVLTAGRAVAYQILDASGAVAFAPSVTAASLNNTANGLNALYSNTTGHNNTANGLNALYSNTTGYFNTANGPNALYSNTTGYFNTANGMNALYSNTTGYFNTANGTYALYDVGPTLKAITAFSDYSGTVAGTVKATSVAHGLTGTSTKQISGTANYDGSKSITVIDVDNFYFTATWVATQTGWWSISTEGNNNTALGYNTGRGIITGSGNSIFGANVTGLAAGLTNNIILANGTGAIKAQHDGTNWTLTGGVSLDKTVTAAGTTGAQTINKPIGTVNFAAAATSLVVTNSLVTSNSIIVATVGTVDTTMKSVVAVAGSGSFTLTANAAATAETRVNFYIFN